MSGSYAVGANYLSFTAGGAGAAGTGAFSIVALVQPGVGNNNAGFTGLYATATLTRGIGESSLNLYGPNDFSSGVGPLTQGNWYVVAVTKSSASAPWRMHYWAYNATPSGSFTHTVAAGASNQGNGSAITEIRIGANGIAQANGLVAAVGVWTSELTDGNIDTLVSTNLSSWAALSPAELISLENWNGTSGAAVPVGASAFSSTTGTVSSGSNPPSFNFSVTVASATPQPLIVSPAAPRPVRVDPVIVRGSLADADVRALAVQPVIVQPLRPGPQPSYLLVTGAPQPPAAAGSPPPLIVQPAPGPRRPQPVTVVRGSLADLDVRAAPTLPYLAVPAPARSVQAFQYVGAAPAVPDAPVGAPPPVIIAPAPRRLVLADPIVTRAPLLPQGAPAAVIFQPVSVRGPAGQVLVLAAPPAPPPVAPAPLPVLVLAAPARPRAGGAVIVRAPLSASAPPVLGPDVVLVLGPPEARWAAGQPSAVWATGPAGPDSRWATGPPEV